MAEIYPVHKNFSRALPGKHNYELAYNSIFDSIKVLTKKLQHPIWPFGTLKMKNKIHFEKFELKSRPSKLLLQIGVTCKKIVNRFITTNISLS